MDLERLSEDRIAAINFCEATLLVPHSRPHPPCVFTAHFPVLLAVTHETAFYGSLNSALRSTNRDDIKPFFPW